MSTVVVPPLTVRNYRLLPETGPRYQLIQGRFYMAPAPSRYHQEISRNLELILGNYLDENPIGKLYDAPFDVVLDEVNVFQPDILFVSRERYGILTDAGAEGAPDFIAEILSPRTAKLDLENKHLEYAQHGVRELWIIDPKVKKITVYHLDKDADAPVAVHGADARISCRMFPGLEIDMAKVFAE